MKPINLLISAAFLLCQLFCLVSCKSIMEETVISECEMCSREGKEKRKAFIEKMSKIQSDDDDDDEAIETGFSNIEQYHRHLRNTIRQMTKLEALCQCNPYEYDTLDAFEKLPFNNTLLYKNLQRLNKMAKGTWALRSLFVYHCQQFGDMESFSPCIDKDLAEIIPKDLSHDKSFKQFLFNNTDYTLSTIAVFDNLADCRKVVVVIPHYKNKPRIFYSQLPVALSEQERKWLSECTMDKNIIKMLSDRICEFERAHTPFGPALFTDFHLLLNDSDLARYRSNSLSRVDDDDEDDEDNDKLIPNIAKRLPCWHVKAATYDTLSREHLPVMMWLGSCYDFVIDLHGQKVDYVRRMK